MFLAEGSKGDWFLASVQLLKASCIPGLLAQPFCSVPATSSPYATSSGPFSLARAEKGSVSVRT